MWPNTSTSIKPAPATTTAASKLPSYASGLVAAATVGTFESDQCGIELMLTVPGNDKLDGKAVWFEYDAPTRAWQCSSEIDDKYLPSTCRG